MLLLAMDSSKERYIGIIYGEKNKIKQYMTKLKVEIGIGTIHMSKLSRKLKQKVLSYFLSNEPTFEMYCATVKLHPGAYQISRMSKKKATKQHMYSVASSLILRLKNKGIREREIDEVHVDTELKEIASILFPGKYVEKTEYCELADVVSYLNSRKLDGKYGVIRL